MSAVSLANVDGSYKFKIILVGLDLLMENNEHIDFCLFSIILKNSQVTNYGIIKTFFCLVANAGLTDLSRFFLVTPRGSLLLQIVPPPSSLTHDPV